MKKFKIIAADGTMHDVLAYSAEAACVWFECCAGYPFIAMTIVDSNGESTNLQCGHMPIKNQWSQ